MSERTYVDASGQLQPDRRGNDKLRRIFEHACELIGPFFDPANSWSGQSLDLLAFRVLREHYPDLTGGEVEVIVAAYHRVRGARRE